MNMHVLLLLNDLTKGFSYLNLTALYVCMYKSIKVIISKFDLRSILIWTSTSSKASSVMVFAKAVSFSFPCTNICMYVVCIYMYLLHNLHVCACEKRVTASFRYCTLFCSEVCTNP